MLNNKSDYKKVKQDQFGNSNRITVDGNVYGKRTQKLIKQNEDVVYLAEANGVVNNVRDNSILIDFPFYSSEVKFPLAPIQNFVDPYKFEAVEISGQDVFKKTGGQNPDIQQLRERWNQIANTRTEFILSKKIELENYKNQLNDEKKNELKVLQEKKEAENAKFPSVQEKYTTDIEKANKYKQDEKEILSNRERDARHQYSEKTISKSEYIALLIEIDNDRQDMELTYYSKVQDASLTKEDSLQTIHYAIYEIESQIDGLDDKYKKLYEKKEEEIQTELNSYDEQFNTERNQLYCDSNFEVAISYDTKYEETYQKIKNLDIYCSTDGMYKTYPWNLGKESTEYMDRLFADWEKLTYKRISNYSYKKHCNGIIEHYKGEDAHGYHWVYDRFTNDSNYIYYDYDYDNAPYDTATYDVIDSRIDIRLGSRYDVGKIKNLYLIASIYGEGVDGKGKSYHLIKASKEKVIEEEKAKEFDAIEDQFYTEKDSSEETYKLLVEAEKVLYNTKLKELDEKYEADIKKIDDDEIKSIEDIRNQYISSIQPLLVEYNTMVVEGEDASGIRSQIDQQLTSMRNSIATEQQKAEDARQKANDNLNKNKKEAEVNYKKKLQEHENDFNKTVQDLTKTMTDAKSEFQNRVNEEYKNKRDEIYNKYESALDAAQKKHDSGANALADQESALFDQLMESWKAEHGDTEPSDWSDPEVQEHFRPYNQMVEEHVPMYNALLVTLYNERCDAEVQYAQDESEIYEFDENGRELWTFNGSQYRYISDNFTTKDQVYGNGAKFAQISSVLLVVAEMDYGWKMGVQFKNYEEEDKARQGNP